MTEDATNDEITLRDVLLTLAIAILALASAQFLDGVARSIAVGIGLLAACAVAAVVAYALTQVFWIVVMGERTPFDLEDADT